MEPVKETLVATRFGDALYHTYNEEAFLGTLRYGYMLHADGSREENVCIDCLLRGGYWEEIV